MAGPVEWTETRDGLIRAPVARSYYEDVVGKALAFDQDLLCLRVNSFYLTDDAVDLPGSQRPLDREGNLVQSPLSHRDPGKGRYEVELVVSGHNGYVGALSGEQTAKAVSGS